MAGMSLLSGGNGRLDGRDRENPIALLERRGAGAFMGRTLEGFPFRP
jgi:hypothetical protein